VEFYTEALHYAVITSLLPKSGPDLNDCTLFMTFKEWYKQEKILKMTTGKLIYKERHIFMYITSIAHENQEE
jgi:hypothetical protein